jgi:hypothetical protein
MLSSGSPKNMFDTCWLSIDKTCMATKGNLKQRCGVSLNYGSSITSLTMSLNCSRSKNLINNSLFNFNSTRKSSSSIISYKVGILRPSIIFGYGWRKLPYVSRSRLFLSNFNYISSLSLGSN